MLPQTHKVSAGKLFPKNCPHLDKTSGYQMFYTVSACLSFMYLYVFQMYVPF